LPFPPLRPRRPRGVRRYGSPCLCRCWRRFFLAFCSVLRRLGAYSPFTRAGGLMSYGSDLGEAYRAVGTTAARVLRGEKPADISVQETTKVEFVVNLKSAQALGLKIPQQLIAIANEIIE
jgi:ABC transporter substrate binding protein